MTEEHDPNRPPQRVLDDAANDGPVPIGQRFAEKCFRLARLELMHDKEIDVTDRMIADAALTLIVGRCFESPGEAASYLSTQAAKFEGMVPGLTEWHEKRGRAWNTP